MLNLLHKFAHAENGATAIEYGMIIALMTIAIVGSIQALGQGITNTLYNKLATLF